MTLYLKGTVNFLQYLVLFLQKCRWQVTPKHAYILDPKKSEWADYAGTCKETSSHATCHRTFGHSLLSSLSQCGLILGQKVELQ